jgi:hypothetical protein
MEKGTKKKWVPFKKGTWSKGRITVQVGVDSRGAGFQCSTLISAKVILRSNISQYTGRFLGLLVAMMTALPAAHAALQENPAADATSYRACSNLGEYIFVGGTAGFDALRQGDQFEELLRTGHVGLYEHGNAVSAAENPPSIIRGIEKVFRGTGAGEAELGQVGWNYFTLPPSYGYYKQQYIENGLHPSEANVNTLSDSAGPGQLEEDLKQWREYVDAARTVGIRSVAPIVGPNDPSEPKLGEDVFATNPFYALERGEALYGKAIAFDVPPRFFLTGGSGPGYEKFIVQAIQWGNAHGLRTTVLLSPYPWPANADGQPVTFDQFTDNTFSGDTEVFVSRLVEEHAVPSEWAVDIMKIRVRMMHLRWCPRRCSIPPLK